MQLIFEFLLGCAASAEENRRLGKLMPNGCPEIQLAGKCF